MATKRHQDLLTIFERDRTADLVFRRARVAVFTDGCFWHGCPIHHTKAAAHADFWAQKVEQNMQRDCDTEPFSS